MSLSRLRTLTCFIVLPLLLLISCHPSILAYDATWESLDSRPLPAWYDDAKFGIFIHWGAYSVPAFHNGGFWYYWQRLHHPEFDDFVNKTERPGFAYPEYAHRFDALFYEPNDWASIFAKSGAQYVVLTSKHHEGFCIWDSRDIPATWNWNSMDVGPHRDLVGDLAKAVKNTSSPHTKKSLRFGLYHSMFEWFNPMYHADAATNFTTQTFVDTKSMPELYDLVKKYEPDIIWSDGAWSEPSSYWKSTEFLAWLATNSSVSESVVWNDRWGKDSDCKHGSFWNCKDNFLPDGLIDHKWENCRRMDTGAWGLSRVSKYEQYETVKSLLDLLVKTVAFGGNLLLNIGPAGDGTIRPIFVDRLTGIGEWLSVNGEAIYGTKPWRVCQNETAAHVFYTTKDEILYAHFTEWPEHDIVTLDCPIATDDTKVRMLGLSPENSVEWKNLGAKGNATHLVEHSFILSGVQVQLPPLTPATIPCQHVWVLAFSNLANIHVE